MSDTAELTEMSWHQGRSYCMQQGGELISIHSKEEQDMTLQMVSQREHIALLYYYVISRCFIGYGLVVHKTLYRHVTKLYKCLIATSLLLCDIFTSSSHSIWTAWVVNIRISRVRNTRITGNCKSQYTAWYLLDWYSEMRLQSMDSFSSKSSPAHLLL